MRYSFPKNYQNLKIEAPDNEMKQDMLNRQQVDEYIDYVIRTHRDEVYRNICLYLKDRGYKMRGDFDVDDLLQEACQKLHAILLSGHPLPNAPKPYLFTIAKNCLLAKMVSVSSRSTESLDKLTSVSINGGAGISQEILIDTKYQPDMEAQSNEGMQFIYGQIAVLRQIDQRVIDLAMNGHTNLEIAQALALSLSNVKHIKQKVRGILHQKIVQREKEMATERKTINEF